MRNQGIAAAVGLVLSACTGEIGFPTREEFAARTYQEPDTGMYILNGDEVAQNLDEVYAYYDRFYNEWQEVTERTGTISQGLIVNTVNGADDKWPAGTVLKYCIDTRSFGANHAAAEAAMAYATSEWVTYLDRNTLSYEYHPELNGNCNVRQAGVDFDVRMVRTRQYLARAFFPSTSRRGREILVALDTFGDITPWTVNGVMLHEVGHTIGFRHEHTRPESGVCFENNQWRELTEYDSASVMHYPHCNGTQTGDLVLTDLDKEGAGVLY
jgi:hypothetical protein